MLHVLFSLAALSLQGAPLVPGNAVLLPKPGRFDYMAVDTKYGRIFATHGGAKTLAVLDIKTGKASDLDVGQVNGVQIDQKLSRVIVTGGGQTVVSLDRKSLKKLIQIALSGPGDDLAIDTKRQQIYVCHDDGSNLWVFDAKTLHSAGNVELGGIPEYVEYDAATDRLYQNIKDKNTILVINPSSKKVVATWATGDETSPHGLALDRKTGKLFSAGSNGKMDVFNFRTGKLLTVIDIAPGTDQIVFDEGLKRVYTASRGFISVVQETAAGAKSLGKVVSPQGAHTITVDPRSHTVWVCYADGQHAYLKPFTVGR